ncbi:MAG: hypothetical protein J0M31_23425, partial [Candidatus Accumulibacter sp.]|nr:hypothetical protein [Accumulibacter sp.]
MKLPFQRKPLTLIFCCTFAGTLAVSCPGAARAQGATPFRVDPRLLGLPPATPARPAVDASLQQPAAEPRAVEQPVVEAYPLPAPPTAAVDPGPRGRTAVPTPAASSAPAAV